MPAESIHPGVRVLSNVPEHTAFCQQLAEGSGDIGATLLRGTGVRSEEQFERLVRTATPELLDYDYASTPRSRLSGQVYTSTEYPPDQTISLHNEMSYAASWPRIVWFACLQPAEQGGATPLCDSREVYRRIPDAVRRSFEERGVLYRRMYNTGLDLTWQQAFGTTQREVVEQYCRRAEMTWQWLPGDVLKTEQRRPASVRHRESGQNSWFNQAHLFHPSSLAPEVRELLLDVVGPEGLPRTACYGDGGEIEPEALEAIRAAYAEAQFEFAWHSGDVLAVDNVAFAHGRRPFVGERRVLVAMA